MHLTQALPLLALELDRTYLYGEIAVYMPPPKQDKIEEVLARYARYNHFRGYDLPKGKTQAEFAQELEATHGTYAKWIRVDYRLKKKGRYSRAFSGAVWHYHAGQKTLQEALVFALSAWLSPTNCFFQTDQLLQSIPTLAASPEWQHRMGQQVRRLLNAYDLLVDGPATPIHANYWASFVAPEVRLAVCCFIVGSRPDLVAVAAAERPKMVALVAIRLQQAQAAKSRYWQSLLPKPKALLIRPKSTKTPALQPPRVALLSKLSRNTWLRLAIGATLVLGAIGFSPITTKQKPAPKPAAKEGLILNVKPEPFYSHQFGVLVEKTKVALQQTTKLTIPYYIQPIEISQNN